MFDPLLFGSNDLLSVSKAKQFVFFSLDFQGFFFDFCFLFCFSPFFSIFIEFFLSFFGYLHVFLGFHCVFSFLSFFFAFLQFCSFLSRFYWFYSNTRFTFIKYMVSMFSIHIQHFLNACSTWVRL